MKLLEMKNVGAEIKYINTLDIINSKLGTTVGGAGVGGWAVIKGEGVDLKTCNGNYES